MSVLLKSGAGPAVRPFALNEEEARPAPVDPVAAERSAFVAEVAKLRQALKVSESKAAEAVAGAREQGRLAGLAEADEREEARLSLLGAGIERATAGLAEQLELLERLAPALARAGLAKMFDVVDAWAPMVEATLARQLLALRRSAVVAVQVSPADFESVATLGDKFGAGVRIELDPELAAGGCRIQCKLGQFDLDVREQHAELAALLDAMARDEAA